RSVGVGGKMLGIAIAQVRIRPVGGERDGLREVMQGSLQVAARSEDDTQPMMAARMPGKAGEDLLAEPSCFAQITARLTFLCLLPKAVSLGVCAVTLLAGAAQQLIDEMLQ